MTTPLRLSVLLTMLLPLASFGHHSPFLKFDTQSSMEIEGIVTKVTWVNPHVYVTVERTDELGKREAWDLEAQGATDLQRAGIEPDSIAVGARIKAAGSPPRTASKEMYVTNIFLIESGEELLLRDSAKPIYAEQGIGNRTYKNQTEGNPSRPELGLLRVWSFTNMSNLYPEEDDVNNYPLTEATRATLRERPTDSVTRNCIPKGMPTIMENPFPMEFIQDGDDITLRIEEYDTERRIHMDEETAPPDVAASPLGYSVGRRVGAGLVVTTTRLNWPWFNQLGWPQSEAAVLVERFTPTQDGSRLDYEVTITDPVNFTEPVTLHKFWLYLPDQPGQKVMPYRCTERN